MSGKGRRQAAQEQFALQLVEVQVAAGSPSNAELHRISLHLVQERPKAQHMVASPPPARALTTTLLSELLNGKSLRLPDWDVVSTFLDACAAYATRRRVPLPKALIDRSLWLHRHAVLRGLLESIPEEESDEAIWPLQLGRLPPQAAHFQDRSQLEDLRRALTGGGMAVLTGAGSVGGPDGPSSAVLSGTGGIGKTQIAARYVRAALTATAGRRSREARTGRRRAFELGVTTGEATADRDATPEGADLVLWANAVDRSSLVADYAEAYHAVNNRPPGSSARDASCRPGGDRAVEDHEQAARLFLQWLANTRHSWLVVLDDVPSPGDLAGLWPPRTPGGRVVVTTRSRDAAWTTDTRKLLGVGLFAPEQSLTYLRRALTHPQRTCTDSDKDIAALASDLGHLPIALAQAAAYLVDSDRAIPRYRELLQHRARTLAQALPAVSGLPDSQTRTVAALWEVSVQRADTQQPSGLARPLLELASVMNSDGIPDHVFTTAAARAFLSASRAPDGAGTASLPHCLQHGTDHGSEIEAEDVEDALRVLHRLSLP
ncbi:hypothetical protein ACFRFU_47265 [Streptomyces sp. NPDC056704]|uniref:hypothetical protein n=1 Tax=Streptomyces sp. NPDC056704 TaxID=3345917 RepID=UPI0036A7AC6B